MEWVGDYLRFCLDSGFGGVVLLLLSAVALLLVGLAVLSGTAQAARAFMKGWRENQAGRS